MNELNAPAAGFSDGFAKAHGPNWLEWLGHLKGKPVNMLELGTFRGQSAEWALDNILDHPDARLFCVDTFKGGEEHRLAGLTCEGLEAECRARLHRFGWRAQIYTGETNGALRRFFRDDKFAAVYVDAAHDAMNVLRDAVLAFDLLEDGGVLIFDDYEWTSMEQEVDRPKIAIDAFLACYARRLEVIGVGWQVAIRKLS